MATREFLGHAVATVETDTIVIAGVWAQGDTITLTIDNLDFVITIGTLVTTAQVATTLKQAFNGETLTDTSASCVPTITQGGAQDIDQFSELTASVSSSTVTISCDTDGKPFVMSATENTAGTGTATLTANVTVAHGPNEADNADNYSGNAVPTNNDTMTFDFGNSDLLYDLSMGVQLATFNKSKAYSGNIGLAIENADDANAKYAEYRTPRYLTFSNNSVTTTYNIETFGEGPGSSRIMIDAGAGQSIVNVYGAGTRELPGVPCVLFLGSHASNVLNNFGGDVGVAFYAGETATIVTLNTGGTTGLGGSARTFCGAGVSLSGATITIINGEFTSNSALGTVTQNGGTARHYSGNITSLKVLTGRWIQLCGGTVTTLWVGENGIFDKSQNATALTVTNVVQLYKGSTILDPTGSITFSAGFKLNDCTLEEVTVILGPNKTYTPS